jgi:multidrug efflux pump subunit AcrA (membrane-fusion protein)
MKYLFFASLLLLISFSSCKKKQETTTPSIQDITESVYASGIVKSLNQYQAFSRVNGVVSGIYIVEGQYVKKGTPILSVSDEVQKLNKENSLLSATFNDFNTNKGKLNDAAMVVELTKNKMKNDSILYFRQKALWDQQIGSLVELEQRELAFENSKTSYMSSKIKLDDLKRQLDFSSTQAKKNLLISEKMESDYTVSSEIDGIVYSFDKSKGELVNIQTPLAIIGDAKKFLLELEVDEPDIFKIKLGQKVMVSLESYKDIPFEASISKIDPIMNERTKTFTVEAVFIKQPPKLYPNISLEANIVIQSKNKALLIPRDYAINDEYVLKANGDTVKIVTGLKDYQKIEILGGITKNDELIKPTE